MKQEVIEETIKVVLMLMLLDIGCKTLKEELWIGRINRKERYRETSYSGIKFILSKSLDELVRASATVLL
ncbi:conserved hypothetical protein [Ricinus communis]|uniref:Uncharacterized protein n=1 Tax=Ricinus communis TaxID=3988 RepID=B9S1Y9_RICCO|nr:conserved hypothetical protein [Ricinus communis]